MAVTIYGAVLMFLSTTNNTVEIQEAVGMSHGLTLVSGESIVGSALIQVQSGCFCRFTTASLKDCGT